MSTEFSSLSFVRAVSSLPVPPPVYAEKIKQILLYINIDKINYAKILRLFVMFWNPKNLYSCNINT